MILKPILGKVIPDPANKYQPLPPDGRRFDPPYGQYWDALLDAGDVIELPDEE